VPGSIVELIDGIAKGLRKRGMSEDALDVLTVNAFFELVGALEESNRSQGIAPSPFSRFRHMRCSAFVATGSYTKDGRVIIAHNAWTSYMEGTRWTIIFDIAPAQGYRILMDGLPGAS
jgi:hypothetical protein